MSSVNNIPTVAVFGLGGTIASIHDPSSSSRGVKPSLDVNQLLKSVPNIRDIAFLESMSFSEVASGQLSFDHLIGLAHEIESRFHRGVAGAVVIQGTDTIEEMAFGLSLLVGSRKPVVVTGAMRNPTLASADGPGNVEGALRVAASPRSQGIGSVVVFHDEIHDSRFVGKVHTSSLAAFKSKLVGPVGWIVENDVRIVHRPTKLRTISPQPNRPIPSVALLTACLGDDGRLVGLALDAGYEGIVVNGFGGGHVSVEMADQLEIAARQVPVVIASRVFDGEVLGSTYGYPGSETDLFRRGLISAGALSGFKARIVLALLLGAGHSQESIRSEFSEFTRVGRGVREETS